MATKLHYQGAETKLPWQQGSWAYMGPTWGRQDQGGPNVGHVNLAIWVHQLHHWSWVTQTTTIFIWICFMCVDFCWTRVGKVQLVRLKIMHPKYNRIKAPSTGNWKNTTSKKALRWWKHVMVSTNITIMIIIHHLQIYKHHNCHISYCATKQFYHSQVIYLNAK